MERESTDQRRGQNSPAHRFLERIKKAEARGFKVAGQPVTSQRLNAFEKNIVFISDVRDTQKTWNDILLKERAKNARQSIVSDQEKDENDSADIFTRIEKAKLKSYYNNLRKQIPAL